MYRETCQELQDMMDVAQRDCLVLEDALNALGTTRRGDVWTLPVTASERMHEALTALTEQYHDAVRDHDYAARGLTAKSFATPTMPTLSSVGWRP